MKARILRACALVAWAGLAAAQQGTLAGPVAGYVYDAAGHAVRPIRGVPGAAVVGDPLSFGFDLSAAYISPRQDSVFIVSADHSLHLFRLGSNVSEISLNGINFLPQRIVFSPSGTSAALVEMGRARILTGLPSAPAMAGTVSLPAAGAATQAVAPGRKGAAHPAQPSLALSDDGAYLLTVTGGAAQLLGIHGENRSLLPAESGAQVAFAAGGHDAAVMDSTAGLVLVRDVANTAAQQQVAAADAGLASSVGVAFSPDGRTLYVASASAQGIAAFDLNASTRTAVTCDCTPAALIPMGALFRLNDPGTDPLWVVDTGTRGLRIVFVPARSE